MIREESSREIRMLEPGCGGDEGVEGYAQVGDDSV